MSSCAHLQQPLYVLGEHVDLDVADRAFLERAQAGAVERLGDERYGEAAVAEGADRKADAVEGHGTLLYQIALEAGVAFDLEHAREALLADRANAAGCVDVTLHDVPAEAVGGAQRQLEVDRLSLGEPAERGAPERLEHRLRLKAPIAHFAGGEGDAGDGEGDALVERSGELGADREGGAGVVALDRDDAAELGDQTGEHPTPPAGVTGALTTRAAARR